MGISKPSRSLFCFFGAFFELIAFSVLFFELFAFRVLFFKLIAFPVLFFKAFAFPVLFFTPLYLSGAYLCFFVYFLLFCFFGTFRTNFLYLLDAHLVNNTLLLLV